MKRNLLNKCIIIALAGSGLIACGGGGGSDGANNTSRTISSVGTITGFGSIYVNGVKFETNSSSYRVDDDDAFDDSALAVGMKVKIEGTVNADGVTGTATSVYYDDDVEGPIDTGSLTVVDATTKTFSVFGLSVKVDAGSTVFDDGANFDTLAEGQNVEVSGYFDGSQFTATRIELQSALDNEFEVKGTVSAYDGSTVTLQLQNGATAGPFNVSPSAELDIPADPIGLFVEVELMDQSGALVATKIETDDDDLLDDDDHDISIRGLLSEDGSGGLLINGVPFTVDSDTEYEPEGLMNGLAAGMEVKVEGRMQNSVLLAEEVEIEEGDIEISARVIDVDFNDAKNGFVTLDLGNSQSLTVQTDNSTLFEDSSSSDLNDDRSFNLNELAPGTDFVEVEVMQKSTGELVATSIQREDAGGETELEAPVESFVSNASVTLLGITYTVSGSTSYELDDASTDAAGFFSALNLDAMIEVKDVQADGSAEELDLE